MASTEATILVHSDGRDFSLPIAAFQGLPSTLCKGCGHNSITSYLIDACKAVGVNPYTTVKFSGIGCSSKTPAYFLQSSHGFNALHGRMPSVATGASVANHRLLNIGISGDGDTANIGLGQFKHACRRNMPLVYVVENNGCYGLTKGQFSATADKNARLRRETGEENPIPPFDLCLAAIEVEQKEGEPTRVQLHDGSWIVLRALRHDEHKVTNRASAAQLLMNSQEKNEFLTGLIYVD